MRGWHANLMMSRRLFASKAFGSNSRILGFFPFLGQWETAAGVRRCGLSWEEGLANHGELLVCERLQGFVVFDEQCELLWFF